MPNQELICEYSGKLVYATHKIAQRGALRFKGRRHSGFNHKEPPLQPYSCSWCGGWHLGHRQTTNTRARKRQVRQRVKLAVERAGGKRGD